MNRSVSASYCSDIIIKLRDDKSLMFSYIRFEQLVGWKFSIYNKSWRDSTKQEITKEMSAPPKFLSIALIIALFNVVISP